MQNISMPTFSTIGNPLKAKDNPIKYVDQVRQVNKQMTFQIREQLKKSKLIENLYNIVPQGTSLQLYTTGSDGREEKHGKKANPEFGTVETSPREVGLLLDVPSLNKHLANQLEEDCENIFIDSGLFSECEMKYITEDSIPYYRNDATKIWPTRIIDAAPLSFGDKDLILEGKLCLEKFIVNGTPQAKKVIEAMKKKFGDYKKVIKNEGKARFQQQELQHFDLDIAQLHYDPKAKVQLGSVKFGPIRAGQMYLAHKMLKLVENSQENSNILNSIRANTEEKALDLLELKGLPLTPSEVNSFVELYKYFLWCFYVSVHYYSNKNTKSVQLPYPAEFKKNMADFVKLLEKQ